MKSKSELIEFLKQHLVKQQQELVIKNIQSSIRLETIISEEVKLGTTKMGGVPHLRKGKTWPIDTTFDNKPFTFIAQVNLGEINHLEGADKLPPKGILYFFLAYNSFDHGVVLFEEDTKNLGKAIIPMFFQKEKKNWFQKLFKLKGKSKILKECSVKVYTQYDTPSSNSLRSILIQLKANNKIDNKYVYSEQVIDEISRENKSDHHLLGYYFPIQHGYYELEFISSKTKIKDLTKVEIEKALEWRLLFQVDSDKNLDTSWGDWGKIYFFIHKKDLAKADFTKVKIIGECY